jgi:hypothetical protein
VRVEVSFIEDKVAEAWIFTPAPSSPFMTWRLAQCQLCPQNTPSAAEKTIEVELRSLCNVIRLPDQDLVLLRVAQETGFSGQEIPLSHKQPSAVVMAGKMSRSRS